MANYTPGPWEYWGSEQIIGRNLCSSLQREIVFRFWRDPKAEDVMLITKAPEMYELLAELKSLLGTMAGQDFWIHKIDSLFDSIEKSPYIELAQKKREAQIDAFPKLLFLLSQAHSRLLETIDHSVLERSKVIGSIDDFMKEAKRLG